MNTSCCCTTSFRDYVYQCPQTITINTLNLPIDTEYTVLVKSEMFGAVAIPGETNADGQLVIDLIDLPVGFINQYAGEFSISVYNETEVDADLETCTPVRLLIGKYFDDVVIHAKHGDAIKSVIGCAIPS